MEIFKKNISTFILMFISTVAFSQEEQSLLDAISISKEFEISNQGKTTSNTPANSQMNSYILVSQIGNNNASSIVGYFNSGYISVSQFGNKNSSDIFREGNSVKESVFQSGNNNQFVDYSPFSYSNEVNISVNQFGDNLKLYNYGSNSITETLNFTQTGNDQTIIIFNN